MTDDTIEVDISDEDDATLDEIDQQTDGDSEPPEPVSAAPEESDPRDDLREAAKQEAIRLRENADGRNQTEKVRNAIEQAKESYQRNAQQLQSVKQSKQESENRIDRLEMTKGRVRDQPPDCEVLQTLAGGVSLEVPTDAYHEPEGSDGVYTRGDLCDEIDETVEALEGQVDQLEQKEQTMERAIEKIKLAAQLLQQTNELIDSGGDDQFSPAPGAGIDG